MVFRRRISEHLVKVIGQAVFKVSLKNSDKGMANKRSAQALLQWEHFFERPENQLKCPLSLSLSELDIEWAVKSWFMAK